MNKKAESTAKYIIGLNYSRDYIKFYLSFRLLSYHAIPDAQYYFRCYFNTHYADHISTVRLQQIKSPFDDLELYELLVPLVNPEGYQAYPAEFGTKSLMMSGV